MRENATLQPDPENGLPPRQQGGALNDPFQDINTRHKFVRLVMLIVGLQLLVTFLFVALCLFVDDVKLFVQTANNIFIVIICLIIVMVIMLIAMCCYGLFKKPPGNIIILVIFTLAESYLVGFICSFKYAEEVCYALALTVILCFALIIFACQTRCDFTGIGPYLVVASLILLAAGIISIFLRNRIFLIILASIGVLLFSIFLIYDVQLVIGGGKEQFDEDDYILAAITVYMDIILIFLKILELLEILMEE